MALDPFVDKDTHAKLEPALQREYVSRAGKDDDGKFYLTVQPRDGWALENVTAIKTSLGAERAANERHATAIKAFEGLDPAHARAALEKVAEWEKSPPDAKLQKQYDEKYAAAVAKIEKEKEAKDKLAQSYRGTIENTLKLAALTSAIAKHKGSPELLIPAVSGMIQVIEDDAHSFDMRVVDDKGNPRITMQPNSNGAMTVDELIASLKAIPAYQGAFEGHNASGGGSFSGNKGAGTNDAGEIVVTRAAMQDPRFYQKVKAQAEKEGRPIRIT